MIGLACALSFLKVGLTCTVVDSKETCSGATGAGQGYLWMAHRNPLDAGSWKMAAKSKALWEDWVRNDAALKQQGDWKSNGSILLATSIEEASELKVREEMLNQWGIDASYVTTGEVLDQEPSLMGATVNICGGLLTSSDAQINGGRAAKRLLEECLSYKNSFQSIFYDGCEALDVSEEDGKVNGIILESGCHIEAMKGVVIACGAWTGDLLSRLLHDVSWKEKILPRRGHLLVVDPPQTMQPLRRGIMEVGYTKHYTASEQVSPGLDITFTATNSSGNSILLGSSRELRPEDPWSQQPQQRIVAAILSHAASFLPELSEFARRSESLIQCNELDIRVGLRPFAPGGPFACPIPRVPNLYVCSGHEGSGLTLGPITAQVLLHHMGLLEEEIDPDIIASLSLV